MYPNFKYRYFYPIKFTFLKPSKAIESHHIAQWVFPFRDRPGTRMGAWKKMASFLHFESERIIFLVTLMDPLLYVLFLVRFPFEIPPSSSVENQLHLRQIGLGTFTLILKVWTERGGGVLRLHSVIFIPA